MKKTIYILLTSVLVLFNTISCKNDLDIQPLDQFAEDAVWKDPALVTTFVNNIYLGIPHGFSNMMMASLSDESMYNADFGSSNVTKCLVTASDYSVWDFWSGNRYKGMIWQNVYKYIRACNLFLEKIESTPFDNPDTKKRLIGEVYFLRAYLYNNLVSVYGGVPIIKQAYKLSDDFTPARDTYENCIKFIAEDCDKAAQNLLLVNTGADKGRATKGAALALKARVLLHAASDLYNKTPTWAGGFAHPELIGYVGGDRNARWLAAKNAAKAVMDLGAYSIYKATPAAGDSTAKNYGEMFLTKENTEDIFVRFFLPKTEDSWDGYNPGLFNNPNGYHGWGSNTPLQQLVDAYEMKDGSKFSWTNTEHAKNPYKNRDPRFYATILYEGVQWRKRPSDVAASDPKGVIQVGFWEKWNTSTNSVDVIAGLDTRKGPIEDWNGTYSGYYLRKFIDQTIDAQYVKQDLPWRFIRYTEVVLNYAEACIGLGQDAEARQYINMIRKRAGMPEITESGQALVERYRNERRVELAFEDHRFFDVRRWMIAPSTFDNAKGVEIRYPLNPDKTTSNTPTFKVIDVQDRNWKDRAYFLPIKLDEMNKNKNLIQNPLY